MELTKAPGGGAIFVGSGDAGDAVVTPVGELDLAFAPALLRTVRECIAREPRRIIFDLGSVTFIDSAGCDVLARARHEARAAGVRVAMYEEMAPLVRRVLAITRLLPVFDPVWPHN